MELYSLYECAPNLAFFLTIVPGRSTHLAPIRASSSISILFKINLSCSMPNVKIVEFMPKMTFLPILTNSEEIQVLSHKVCFPIFTPKNLKVNRFFSQGNGLDAATNKDHFLIIFLKFQK